MEKDYLLLKRAALLVGHPANGTTMISTCLRTAKLSVVSIRPMLRRLTRLGCGRSRSGTTKVAARRTAMLRPERPPWQPSPRAGGGMIVSFFLLGVVLVMTRPSPSRHGKSRPPVRVPGGWGVYRDPALPELCRGIVSEGPGHLDPWISL